MKTLYAFILTIFAAFANINPHDVDVSVSYKILNDKYDYQFKKSWELWNPPTVIMNEWLLLKSQCYAESAFNPIAVSPVGAQGLCQFMPPTWDQYANGLDVMDPDANINAAAKYMARLKAAWKSERPETDRMKLAEASYNAGLGNLIKAQKKCNNVVLYDGIIKCLPDVTGFHSNETIIYVKRIWKGYWMLLV